MVYLTNNQIIFFTVLLCAVIVVLCYGAIRSNGLDEPHENDNDASPNKGAA
jgi:hypothetical protein